MLNPCPQYPQQQQRMRLAPNAHNTIVTKNSYSPHHSRNSYCKSQMARIYSTESVQETIWMAKERQGELDPDSNGPRSCDNTISTNTESKYDDDELEAAIEAFAWFKGEQRATLEASRLRIELSDALAEVDRLKKYVETVTTDMSRLQIEMQRSEDRNRATSPATPAAPAPSSDALEELSRRYAHDEAMWLREKKEAKEEILYWRGEAERAATAAEQSCKEEMRALCETAAALRKEKESWKNREDEIRLQLKREYSSEIEQLQAQLHSAREGAQSSSRLQSDHDIALASLEDLKEELKLAQEESAWLRADKVIAEEGAKVKSKIAAASEAARAKELLDAREANIALAKELEEARQELEALKKLSSGSELSTDVSLPPQREEKRMESLSVAHSSSAGTSSAQTRESEGQGTVTACALYNLSVQLQSSGKLAEAVPHCQQALSGMRSALGNEHIDTLQCMNTLATILYDLGEFLLAEPLTFECYRGMRAVLGASHESTLTAQVNLALLLQALKKVDEAETLFRDFFDKREGLLDDTHKDSLRAMNNFSLMLQSQGKFAEAEPYCRRSLECMRSTLGEDHADTLQSISNLAMLLYGQGKLEEAEPYCYEALTGMRTTLGNSHMSTLASVSNLAMMLQGQRKLAEAEPYCREALAGMRNTLGNTHSITLASMSNLAMLLYNRGQCDEAEALYCEAFETMRDTLGRDDPCTLSAMSNLAMLQQARGMLDVAESLFRECLGHRRLALGDTHPDTIRSLNSLACLLQSQGKINEAEDIYRESFMLVQQRAEASAAVEVERLREQMSESSQSSQSVDCSQSDDVYANYDEAGLILKGTLSSNCSSTQTSGDSERNRFSSCVRRQTDAISVGNSSHDDCSQGLLSSTSSTARLLMMQSQSPKQHAFSQKKLPLPVELIKCAHDKCRKKFTSMDRYTLHLQVDHKDCKDVTNKLTKIKAQVRGSHETTTRDLGGVEAGSTTGMGGKVYFACGHPHCPQLFEHVVDRNSHEREVHMSADNCNASISSISSNSTGTGTIPLPARSRDFAGGSEPQQVVCPEKSCGKIFTSAKNRNNHMKDAHSMVVYSGVSAPPSLDACDKNAPTSRSLHTTCTSSGSKEHHRPPQLRARTCTVCPFAGCGKQCKSDSALVDHIKDAHSQRSRSRTKMK